VCRKLEIAQNAKSFLNEKKLEISKVRKQLAESPSGKVKTSHFALAQSLLIITSSFFPHTLQNLISSFFKTHFKIKTSDKILLRFALSNFH